MTAPDPLALVGTTLAEKYEIERVVGEEPALLDEAVDELGAAVGRDLPGA